MQAEWTLIRFDHKGSDHQIQEQWGAFRASVIQVLDNTDIKLSNLFREKVKCSWIYSLVCSECLFFWMFCIWLLQTMKLILSKFHVLVTSLTFFLLGKRLCSWPSDFFISWTKGIVDEARAVRRPDGGKHNLHRRSSLQASSSSREQGESRLFSFLLVIFQLPRAPADITSYMYTAT